MLVLGNGHVARVIEKSFGEERTRHTRDLDPVRIIGHNECDITDPKSLRSILKASGDRWVVNVAGKTNVDWCEENQLECLAVNGHAPVTLGLLCKELGKTLIHISTGCMFDGNSVAVTEDSSPNPVAHYAKCKAYADHGLLTLCGDDILILRPRMLISGLPVPSNYMYKVWRASTYSAHTQPNSVTYVPDLVNFIGHAMKRDLRGIYNVACRRPTSPYAIASRVANARPDLVLNEVTYDDVVRVTRVRRVNAVLSTWKAEATGFTFTETAHAIQDCIEGLLNVQGA